MSAMMQQSEAASLAVLREDGALGAVSEGRGARHLRLAPPAAVRPSVSQHISDRFLAISPNPVYHVDLVGRRYVCVSSLPLDGLATREMSIDDLVASYVHPDDQPSILTCYEDVSLDDAGVREFQFRSRTGAGYRWMLAREVASVFGADGRPLELLGVVTDITALVEARQRLAALAVTDELTQLPNRRAFRQRFDQLLADASRGRRFSLVMLDIDHFKKVNDTYGHDVGDQVLVAVAGVLAGRLRRTDFVARVGGEEFALLLADISHEDAQRVAEDLRSRIAQLELPCRVTASFGLCGYEERFASNPNALYRSADAALYRAKHQGRDRVVSA